jgi:hypothetical protein
MSMTHLDWVESHTAAALNEFGAEPTLRAVLHAFLASPNVGPHKDRICAALETLILSLPAPPCPSAPGSQTPKET